jgi:antitoxin YefM
MSISKTYTEARANFAKLCEEAAENLETVYITRRGAKPVALVAASELRALEETAHLLRSPRNAQRLLRALARAQAGEGDPEPLTELRRELGLATNS